MDCDIKLRSLRKIPRYGSDFQHHSQIELTSLVAIGDRVKLSNQSIQGASIDQLKNIFAICDLQH